VDGPGAAGLRPEPEEDGSAYAEVGGDADGGGLVDGVAQQGGGDAGGRGLVVLAGGIEADGGVEVDDVACLVLGDLDVPDAELGAQLLADDPGEAGQVPGQVGGEPTPQVVIARRLGDSITLCPPAVSLGLAVSA
jgi:hypothetical protein